MKGGSKKYPGLRLVLSSSLSHSLWSLLYTRACRVTCDVSRASPDDVSPADVPPTCDGYVWGERETAKCEPTSLLSFAIVIRPVPLTCMSFECPSQNSLSSCTLRYFKAPSTKVHSLALARN